MKTYIQPRVETTRLQAGEMMQGLVIVAASGRGSGKAEAPRRGVEIN